MRSALLAALTITWATPALAVVGANISAADPATEGVAVIEGTHCLATVINDHWLLAPGVTRIGTGALIPCVADPARPETLRLQLAGQPLTAREVVLHPNFQPRNLPDQVPPLVMIRVAETLAPAGRTLRPTAMRPANAGQLGDLDLECVGRNGAAWSKGMMSIQYVNHFGATAEYSAWNDRVVWHQRRPRLTASNDLGAPCFAGSGPGRELVALAYRLPADASARDARAILLGLHGFVPWIVEQAGRIPPDQGGGDADPGEPEPPEVPVPPPAVPPPVEPPPAVPPPAEPPPAVPPPAVPPPVEPPPAVPPPVEPPPVAPPPVAPPPVEPPPAEPPPVEPPPVAPPPAAPQPPANLARGKAARQSSTGFGGTANRAVDGNPQGIYNGGSVTHTNQTPNAWWEVDLGSAMPIGRVVVSNRTDCCPERLNGAVVELAHKPCDAAKDRQLTAHNPLPIIGRAVPARTELTYPHAPTARYLCVRNAARQYLSLAEVEAYAPTVTPAAVPPLAGTWQGAHPHWRDTVILNADGTYRRGNGDPGRWAYDGQTLLLNWQNWGTEILTRQTDGRFRAAGNGFTLTPVAIVAAPAPPEPVTPVAPVAPAAPAHCGKTLQLQSWKGDFLHRPDSPQGVTSWHTGIGNQWEIQCEGTIVRLKSWKGDFLHRPDAPQGVTTWHTGHGNDWTLEQAGDKVRLKSWKGDYLHRPDAPQGATTWHTGHGNDWTLVPAPAQ